MSANTLDAIAAIATVASSVFGLGSIAVAIWATRTAVAAVNEAKQLRLEQTRPEVAVYLDNNRGEPSIGDLVIKNVGPGPAYHVRLRLESGHVPQATGQPAALHILDDEIQFLASGQEIRTVLDAWRDIRDDRFSISARYQRTAEPTEELTDLFNTTFIMDPRQTKGLTHLGDPYRQAAKRIDRVLKNLDNGKITLWTRDADRRDEERRLDQEAMDAGFDLDDILDVLAPEGLSRWRRLRLSLRRYRHQLTGRQRFRAQR